MSAATAANWRRRVRTYGALRPPWDDERRPGGSQVTTDSLGIGSQDATACDFAKSQRAGLAAMIRLARDVSPSPSGAEPSPVRPELSMYRWDAAVMAAPARPEPSFAPTLPVLDRPIATPPKVLDPSGRLHATGAKRRRKRRKASNSDLFAYLLPPLLIAILTVQAVLSLRLVWSNTAFSDEAIYLLTGHAEIEHWLHGSAVPVSNSYLPGAPVIYPPIAAIADSLGGLAAVRILSLVFMLGATSLLWCTTSRIFGRHAAICAAILFAVLGPTLQLGAFATPGAMALFLLAASACCMVASKDRDDSALLLVGGTALLVLANASTYSTLLFDPSVVALAGLTVAADRGLKPAVARCGYIAAGTIGLICALLALGGSRYIAAVLSTTVSRTAGSSPTLIVLTDSWIWTGLVCVLAGVGVIICALRRHEHIQVIILAVLAVSSVLVPLIQAKMHTTTSLSKHVDFGAWFAAAAAGYTLAKLSEIGRWKSLRPAVAVLLLIAAALPAGIMGRTQALKIVDAWPNSARMTADLLSLTHFYPGHYLAEDYYVPAYYLESTISWQRWSGTSDFSYTPPGAAHPLTGLAAYRAAISQHYFSLIVLDFEETTQTDNEIAADIQQSGSYRVVQVASSSVGQYTIWAYEQLQRSGSLHGRR
jgi:hypothetical protein